MFEKRNDEMDPHEILAKGIPRGKAKILAHMLGISESLVQKWMRPTTSEENPGATGALNPIERVDRIFDFLLLYSPAAAQLLATRYQTKLEEFYARLIREPLSELEWQARIGQGLRENAEAIAALIEKAPPEVARREWEEAKLRLEEMVRRIEAGERSQSQP